jgi:hypothetical protein
MNWYERAKKRKKRTVAPDSGTNYSNYLNVNFDNGWGEGPKPSCEKDACEPCSRKKRNAKR